MTFSPTVLALLGRAGPALAAAAPESLLDALGQVPDPRDRQGIRYPLVPVLAIAVCAMLAAVDPAAPGAAIGAWVNGKACRAAAGG